MSDLQQYPKRSSHGFCRACIVTWKKKSSKCPTCEVELDTLVPQRAVESSIGYSLVYCYTRLPSLTDGTGDDDEDDEENVHSSSSSSGAAAGEKRKKNVSSKTSKKSKARIDHCTWEGMLKDAAEHFRHCAFAGAKCEFEGCDVVLARSELVEHRVVCAHRTLICKWEGCVEQLKAVEMEQHQLICPRREVKCPNADAGCRSTIFYEKLAQHRAECLFQLIPCPFADVGCTARMLRRDIEKHEQDQSVQHNRLLLLAFKEQRQVIAPMKNQVVPDSERIVLRVKYDMLTGKDANFVPQKAAYPSRHYSENYIVGGYTTSLTVETKDSRPEYQDHYGLYLSMTNGPFPCKVDFTMEIEHHDGKAASAKKHTATVTYDGVSNWGAVKMISKAEIASPDCPYVKDGYVTFKVTFKFV